MKVGSQPGLKVSTWVNPSRSYRPRRFGWQSSRSLAHPCVRAAWRQASISAELTPRSAQGHLTWLLARRLGGTLALRTPAVDKVILSVPLDGGGELRVIAGSFRQGNATIEGPIGGLSTEPLYFDFMEIGTLRRAETTFYRVGAGVDEAKRTLGEQVESLRERARFIAAHVASVVIGDPAVLTNRRFVEALDVDALAFDPEATRRRWEECRDDKELYSWSFDPSLMDRFRTPARRKRGERELVAGVA